jgi:AbiV family abortive infection protein
MSETKKCFKPETPKIPLYEVEYGIGLIIDNVQEFVKETRMLLENSWTQHAVGLLEFAIQELGKAKLLKKEFNNQMSLRMEDVKKGEKLTPRFVQLPEFYDHSKKHNAGISLLPKEVRKIERYFFSLTSESGFVAKDTDIDESLRRMCLYVDWEKGDWKFPSPTMIMGDMPSSKFFTQLKVLAEAIDMAAEQLKKET